MSIKADINKLTVKDAPVSDLGEQVPAQSIGASLGRADFDLESDDVGGIDSPLTEQSRIEVTTEKFDDFNVWSITELHTIKLTMDDAADRTVVFNFTDPNMP